MGNKTKVKGYIGIFLVVFMLAGFLIWETYLRNDLMYERIAVLQNSKEKGEKIETADITYKNVEVGKFENAITNGSSLKGAIPLIDIPKNIPLNLSYFEGGYEGIQKNFVFKIPEDWIYGLPQSLRAGDQIYFYEIKVGQKVGDLVIEGNNIDYVEKSDDYEFVFSTKVKYVKDSSNKEVISTGEGRKNATSSISSIEVAGTAQDLIKLENKVKEGSKFIILYKEG